MRICPGCGFEDHPMWRPRMSRVMCCYCKLDDVKFNYPDLWAKIREAHPKPYFDGHFMYKLTINRQTKQFGNVERIEKEYYDYMRWGQEPQEKVAHDLWAGITTVRRLQRYISENQTFLEKYAALGVPLND